MLWTATIVPYLGIISREGNDQVLSDDWQALSFSGDQNWAFVGGSWQEKDEHTIIPPPAPWNTGVKAYYLDFININLIANQIKF